MSVAARRHGRRATFSIAAATFALTAGVVVAPTASAGHHGGFGRIVYTHWTSANVIEDIFRVRPNGSDITALTATPAVSDRDPDWNRARTMVAFHRGDGGGGITGLWTTDADGGGLAAVPNTDGGFSPSWAPDGDRLAFVCPDSVGGDTEICAVDLDGSDLEQLTSTPDNEGGPAWSPNGEEIAFSRTPPAEDRSRLLAIDPATLAERGITGSVAGRHDSSPAWSPWGTRLAFSRFVTGSGRGASIRRVNADGTGGLLLSQPAIGADIQHITPAWSPTGLRIAFSIADDDLGFAHLHTMGPFGGFKKQVTFGDVTDIDPSWR